MAIKRDGVNKDFYVVLLKNITCFIQVKMIYQNKFKIIYYTVLNKRLHVPSLAVSVLLSTPKKVRMFETSVVNSVINNINLSQMSFVHTEEMHHFVFFLLLLLDTHYKSDKHNLVSYLQVLTYMLLTNGVILLKLIPRVCFGMVPTFMY